MDNGQHERRDQAKRKISYNSGNWRRDYEPGKTIENKIVVGKIEEDSVILRGHKFPRAWDRLVGLVHYLTRNDDVEPWECVYLPRSRRKSTDTRRWLPFSRPFEWNRNSSLTLASVDTQRSSEEERDGRVSVCMWERPSSTSGSNQMQVNPGCFSTFKGPPHIGEIDHSLTVRTFDFVVWNWFGYIWKWFGWFVDDNLQLYYVQFERFRSCCVGCSFLKNWNVLSNAIN